MIQDLFSNGIVRLYHISTTTAEKEIVAGLTSAGDGHIIITNLDYKSDDEDTMMGVRSQRGT